MCSICDHQMTSKIKTQLDSNKLLAMTEYWSVCVNNINIANTPLNITVSYKEDVCIIKKEMMHECMQKKQISVSFCMNRCHACSCVCV